MQQIELNMFIGSEGRGSQQGQLVRNRLEAHVSQFPSCTTFALSLEGIASIDSVFARVAILDLVVLLRREKAFYLLGGEDPDLLENWDNAARRCQQPLYWSCGYGQALLLGPTPHRGEVVMLDHVLNHSCVSASEAARDLNLTVQNASNKLYSLYEHGYILREEQWASTGGREYLYRKIV